MFTAAVFSSVRTLLRRIGALTSCRLQRVGSQCDEWLAQIDDFVSRKIHKVVIRFLYIFFVI